MSQTPLSALSTIYWLNWFAWPEKSKFNWKNIVLCIKITELQDFCQFCWLAAAILEITHFRMLSFGRDFFCRLVSLRMAKVIHRPFVGICCMLRGYFHWIDPSIKKLKDAYCTHFKSHKIKLQQNVFWFP